MGPSDDVPELAAAVKQAERRVLELAEEIAILEAKGDVLTEREATELAWKRDAIEAAKAHLEDLVRAMDEARSR